MPLGDYLIGLLLFAGTWGAAGMTAVLVVRRRLGHLPVAPRLLAGAIVATSALIAAHLLPGLLGLLSRWSSLVVALLVLIAASRLRPAPPEPERPAPEPGPSGPFSWAIAGLAAAVVGLCGLASALSATALPPTEIDSLTFHLPNVARWIQSGTFWRVDQFTPLLANGNYPHNGDVVFLSVVQPWWNDAFVSLVNPLFLAIAALAVYGLAGELGASRATAALFGAVFASTPVVLFAAFEGQKTDTIMLAMLGAGLLFLLRHRRTDRRSDLVLAGLGLGLAFGTKWYAVSSVAVVLLVWAVASLAARRSPRRVLADGAALTGLVGLAGGFWLVRNLVESENPLFPVEVRLLGTTIFDAPRDFIRECAGYTIADYAGSPGVWTEYVLPGLRITYELPGLLIGLGALAATALAVRGRAGLPLAGAACAALLALSYSLTPYTALGPKGEPVLLSANTRYLVPALLAAAPLAAWAVARAGRARGALELLALVGVVEGVRHGLEVSAARVAAWSLLVLIAAAAAWLGRRLTRGPDGGRARAARAALVALALVLAAGLGHARQREHNDDRYAGTDPTIEWINRHASEGHRIGLAGVWGAQSVSPVYPSFGPRLGNVVEFVGETVAGQLREYEDRARWVEAVRAGGYDLLLVGRGGYPERCRLPGMLSDDDAWARAQGFQRVASSRFLTLYRVPSGRRRA